SSYTTTLLLTAPPTCATSLLSLPDALPIYRCTPHPTWLRRATFSSRGEGEPRVCIGSRAPSPLEGLLHNSLSVIHLRGLEGGIRSEEHTSELQSRENLVCRLLLEKKNQLDT